MLSIDGRSDWRRPFGGSLSSIDLKVVDCPTGELVDDCELSIQNFTTFYFPLHMIRHLGSDTVEH